MKESPIAVAGGADPGLVADIVRSQPGSPPPATTPSQHPLHSAVVEVLRQGESFLLSIDSGKYTQKVPSVFDSAIGGHYRHCLDHFQSLLHGLHANEVSYDHRERDPMIENDRDFALAETQRIVRACEAIPASFFACPINVRSQVGYDGNDVPTIGSTVGRELMYAVAHTIHHYALIAVMCGLIDVPVPDGFGVAPSTLRYRSEQQKAA